jgi:hypothetical protein
MSCVDLMKVSRWHMKKKALFLAFAWALSPPAGAQLKVETVQISGKDTSMQASGTSAEITMPLVLPLTEPAPANINDALYVELFNVLAPPRASKKFDVGSLDGTTTQEFSVTRNDRIFTVEFDTEGCGAYCESYHRVFAFDAKSGRRITVADLLANPGQDEIARLLRKQKIAAYSEQITINRTALQAPRGGKAAKDEIDDLNDRIALNTACLQEARTPIARESLGWYRMNPARDGLQVSAPRCSNHAMHALDDVDEVTVKIPYTALKAHLTPYGRALLLGEGDGKPSGPFGQVLRGRIGANPITMVLNMESGANVNGSYFYNRQRKKLALQGQRHGNTIELTETAGEDATPTGKFSLTINGLSVGGKWSDMSGTRQFEVTASFAN